MNRLKEIDGFRPIHVGIDNLMTLDKSSGIEKLFIELTQPTGVEQSDEHMSGDVGGSAPHTRSIKNSWLVINPSERSDSAAY